ncbi:hypothetical protein R1sor_013495 [Riccia sorocarpa]|uniref:Uncharacterized protein n=1 Tax=Riccia sorocarpa TaxID=122646 RepID=A0ABD3H8L1_9MARC
MLLLRKLSATSCHRRSGSRNFTVLVFFMLCKLKETTSCPWETYYRRRLRPRKSRDSKELQFHNKMAFSVNAAISGRMVSVLVALVAVLLTARSAGALAVLDPHVAVAPAPAPAESGAETILPGLLVPALITVVSLLAGRF